MSTVYSDDSEGEGPAGRPKSGVMLENPDGSFSHALPTGTHYKRGSNETPPLDRGFAVWDPAFLEQIERLYSRHERVFIILLFIQFLLENSFNALLIQHSKNTADEIFKVYPFVTSEWAPFAFWAVMITASLFACIYYISAAVAVYNRRAIYMRIFTDIAICGIIGQIFFAYINRFNLILFFLRFVVFTHGRFLFAILTGNARIVITGGEPIVLDV